MINEQDAVDLNITFNGKYYFLLWVLKKYKTELPYCGQVKQFALMNNYSEKVCDAWRRYGVGYKVWNILHKDLVILFLVGKIQMTSLPELEQAWQIWKKDDSILK
jgi:hypothetical protein